MPRANRYFLSSRVWHITHRCHKQDFLLKFALDRAAFDHRAKYEGARRTSRGVHRPMPGYNKIENLSCRAVFPTDSLGIKLS